MFDYRPGRRQIVAMLMSTERWSNVDCRGQSPGELDEMYRKYLLDAWRTQIRKMFTLADLMVEVDLETEADAPVDRPRF